MRVKSTAHIRLKRRYQKLIKHQSNLLSYNYSIYSSWYTVSQLSMWWKLKFKNWVQNRPKILYSATQSSCCYSTPVHVSLFSRSKFCFSRSSRLELLRFFNFLKSMQIVSALYANYFTLWHVWWGHQVVFMAISVKAKQNTSTVSEHEILHLFCIFGSFFELYVSNSLWT